MPAEFEACVRSGGRVRTKAMPGGKFMRICFDKQGKSHAGEVMKKEESMGDLSLIYQFNESSVDQEKRTVVCGVLEEDCLSANDRFYPAHIVREAIGTLSGKKALVGHDSDSPMDVVAVIEKSEMNGRLGIGHFRFGKDQVSETILQKIKDGLINSVSIRASGETKRGKINNNEVDVVQKLDIFSVDFVVEGGVSSAKVLQVFENAPAIDYTTVTKEDLQMDADLKKQLEEAQAKLKEVEEARAKELEEKKAIEEKAKKAEVENYKLSKLSTIEDKDLREEIGKGIKGQTKEEVDEQFEHLKNLLEKMAKKTGSKIVIEAKKEDDKEEFKSINDLFESKEIDKKDKVDALKALFDNKVS